ELVAFVTVNGTLALADGATLGNGTSGTGTLIVDGTLTTLGDQTFGGTLTDNGTVNGEALGETLTLNGATEVTNLATLNIVSTLDIGSGGSLTMDDGSLFGAGTGTLIVDGTLTTLGDQTFGGTLTDNGTVNVEGLGETLTLNGATEVTNLATLNIVSTLDIGSGGSLTMDDGSLFGAGTGTLIVDGTLTTLGDQTFGGTLTDN